MNPMVEVSGTLSDTLARLAHAGAQTLDGVLLGVALAGSLVC